LQPVANEPGMVQGLGLYLVTLMIERLRWRLEIADSTEHGSTLVVHFGVN
jgi:K+-sensing histidine kinase KdpD